MIHRVTEVLNWLTKHQTYVTVLFIPLFSFASYLAFIKSKYNYIEHLIMNFYITGQQMIIYLILGLIFFKDNVLMGVPVILGTIFNLWALHQFFQDKTILKKILLIIFTYILFIIENSPYVYNYCNSVTLKRKRYMKFLFSTISSMLRLLYKHHLYWGYIPHLLNKY